MAMQGGLHLVRDGDAVILQARDTMRWFGALFGGFAVFWLFGWIGQSKDTGLGFWLGLLMGLAFAGIGLFMLLPREISTVFDVRSQRVLHHVSFCRGLYERRHTYAFDEIEGLGVKEYAGEGYSYMPVLVLRGGKLHWLATVNGGYLAFAKTIEEVCAATGLAKVDMPHQGRWGS
jgi:hypothetical protein